MSRPVHETVVRLSPRHVVFSASFCLQDAIHFTTSYLARSRRRTNSFGGVYYAFG